MGQVVTHSAAIGRDSNGPQMSLLEADDIYRWWPHITEMLESVPHTWEHWTIEEFEAQALAKHIQVWGVGLDSTISLVLFTQVAVYPSMRTLQVIWAGGSFAPAMIPILDATLCRFGELQGCAKLEVLGRVGWERMFKDWGMRRTSIVLSKPIRKMREN